MAAGVQARLQLMATQVGCNVLSSCKRQAGASTLPRAAYKLLLASHGKQHSAPRGATAACSVSCSMFMLLAQAWTVTLTSARQMATAAAPENPRGWQTHG